MEKVSGVKDHCEGGEVGKKNVDFVNYEEVMIGKFKRRAYKLINTSPAPGSGISNSSIFVLIEPGLSYTTALYFLGMSTEAIFAHCSQVAFSCAVM